MWAEIVSDLVGTSPPDGPLGFLGNDVRYAALFERVRLKTTGERYGLETPWPKPSGQRFWTFYLGDRMPGDASGRTAWNVLVPLRDQCALVPDPKLQWLEADLFYYPFGLGLIVSVGCAGKFQPQDVIDLAHDIRFAARYALPTTPGSKQKLNVSALADKVLSRARSQRLGCASASGEREGPFTVLTVTQGSANTTDAVPVADSDVHRMLESVTAWKDVPRQMVPDLTTGLVRKADEAHDVALYARERGRAVWSPAWFKKQPKNSWKLSCYHRNLASMSLQVENLGLFARDTAQRPWEDLGERHRLVAKRAADMLGRLYSGAGCYRSESAPRQIVDRGFLGPIAQLREATGLPKIHA